jgi:hypothetical protein
MAGWAVIALLLILLLVGEAGAMDDPVLWLARAVEGECSVMGTDLRRGCGLWITHVALNRVGNRWFPSDTVEVVREGFAGAHVVDQPSSWAIQAAKDAIAAHENGQDPTRGALFAFGGQDLRECTDLTHRTAMMKREGYAFSVHLFTRWPFTEACPPIPYGER